jgi:MFS family permease
MTQRAAPEAARAAGRSADPAAVRRRTLLLLTVGQILGGLGMGAAISVGALAANDLAGEVWSGFAGAVITLGAAALAVPLARVADRRGRRVSLSAATLIAAIGAALCVLAITVRSLPLLFLGLAMVGAATAAGLQSRFAATDLATPETRGRDLSLVVWSTTIGAVTGPNLAGPGSAIGASLGLPGLAGVFVFPVVTLSLAAVAYLIWMRPDPLLESRRIARVRDAGSGGPLQLGSGNPVLVRVAIITVALSHATMVALMSMTPVHLVHGGATLSVVGFTISLHIAGMYALSPLFGILSDRWGRLPTVVLGQALLIGSAVITALGAHEIPVVMIGLIMLGLGWSAATVAGSALLTDAAPPDRTVVLQGRSDLSMNLAGAIGGAASGPLLAAFGYSGLAWILLLPAVAVLVTAAVGTRLGGSGSRPAGRWTGQ